MSVAELPDVETLVVKHLLDDATLKTAGLKLVAGPAFPDNPDWPWVRVHRSGGPAPIPFWLDGGRCQIDVWGTEDTTLLRSITSKVFASLQGLVGVHELGVVTAVEETVPRAYIPGEGGRPRYLFEIRVFAHPLPS